MSELGKWERIARKLAEAIREQERLEVALAATRSTRAHWERELSEELAKEQAPLGHDFYERSAAETVTLDPWAIGRPSPARIARAMDVFNGRVD